MRGPLDIIKEGWTGPEEKEDDVLSYVQCVYDRLEEAKDIVQANMRRA